ncbi:MAG: hypothetical protein HY657_13740 [Acidobacteria bacterium]|nr:hypothetical protein [Acidobacteriota bacterium]
MRDMRTSFLLLAALLFATPALAQVDISGEWGRNNHEDQPHRGPGAELGDYTGMPINAVARQWAESWDASILSQPEQQARPHPAQYSMRGPQPNMRIQKIVDPVTARLIAYTLAGFFGRADRVIWMDGRPHPSEYAEHTWGGFSTGEWVDGQLVVTTTHMKQSFVNRNGVPSSHKGVMTEWFIRHGDRITVIVMVDDPVYLEEPVVRTNDFIWNPGQNVGAGAPFETVDELGDKPRGWVPHWPIGTRHTGFAEHWDLPFDATRGGAESLYPEYVKKIQEMMKATPPASASAAVQ